MTGRDIGTGDGPVNVTAPSMLGDFIARARKEPPALDDGYWDELTEMLAADLLESFSVEKRHLQFLTYTTRRDTADLRLMMYVSEALNKAAPARFRNASELFERSGLDFGERIDRKARRLLRRVFLDEINRRLQSLYRLHLEVFPCDPASTHRRRIDAMGMLLPRVRRILEGCNLPRMLSWLELEPLEGERRRCLRELANHFFTIHQVNFRFTYHCNITCRHCYNSSGPHRKQERLDINRMLCAVDEMPRLGVEALNLTGGEPMLYPDVIHEMIEAARGSRLRSVRINSNGFWARSPEGRRRALDGLRAAGFSNGSETRDYIKVSTGPYHQEFVALQWIFDLAREYFDTFGKPLHVDCETLSPSSRERERVKQKFESENLGGKVNVLVRPVAPLGRGRELSELHRPKPITRHCGAVNQIAIDPDGTARPCCGMNAENHGIVIGNVNDDSLETIVGNLQNNPILQFISTRPLVDIFDHLGHEARSEGYTDICSLCEHALGGVVDTEPLKAELFPSQQYFPFRYQELCPP